MTSKNIYGMKESKFAKIKAHYDSLPNDSAEKKEMQDAEFAHIKALSDRLQSIGFKPSPSGGLSMSFGSLKPREGASAPSQ